ncbi:MAG: hypothetical protein IAG13_25990 [Deltaproteobacteria bacterium]|nr:hypothetical protein [Nannocystaceae bacterium]
MRQSAIGLLGLAACVLGWRGEASIAGVHDLDGIVSVRIDLPSTPLSVVACDPEALTGCPAQLRYAGRFLSTGGSARDAENHAQQAALRFDRDAGLGSLHAELPLAVRGLVELEIEEIELPSDRDIELVTDRGDVEVFGARRSVAVRTETGDVTIDGGDAGVAVDVDDGDVYVRSPGDVDLFGEQGAISMVQTGAPRRVHIRTGHGGVRLELAASTDLDLDVRADGEIRVTTAALVVRTEDRLRRTTGAGSIEVTIDAGGSVEIVERQP